MFLMCRLNKVTAVLLYQHSIKVGVVFMVSVSVMQVVLSRVQENPANTVCADCQTSDPVWGVINRGIMVCINCSGVHRSFGAHISKVRSIELDEEVWKNENLKQVNGQGITCGCY